MMRIQPISSTVTLLMAAIVFGAPLVVNAVMATAHGSNPGARPPSQCSALVCDGVDMASNLTAEHLQR